MSRVAATSPGERFARWQRRRGVPEAIRITRVGLWFVLFTVVVGVAATNTGNNALYLVLATMLALLVTSGLTSRWNLRRLEISVEPPGELYARRPAVVEVRVTNHSRWMPRWLVLVGLSAGGPWRLVPYLAAGGTARGTLEVLFPRRGRQRVADAHVASLFPLGLFRKGLRYGLDLELLVYPELYPAGEIDLQFAAQSGEHSAPRPGWGHELHALRAFRPGDDPRAIHWKKSAQTGDLVYQERETEETLRLSILLDNGLDRPSPSDLERFEELVSEAATAAWDHLERGFEVELATRSGRIPFGSGRRQRTVMLTELALLEPSAAAREPLRPGDAGARQLRLGTGVAGGAGEAA